MILQVQLQWLLITRSFVAKILSIDRQLSGRKSNSYEIRISKKQKIIKLGSTANNYLVVLDLVNGNKRVGYTTLPLGFSTRGRQQLVGKFTPNERWGIEIQDDCIYTGCLRENQRQGYGILIYDKSIYKGWFVNNKKNGYGIFKDYHCKYKGIFYEDELFGLGIFFRNVYRQDALIKYEEVYVGYGMIRDNKNLYDDKQSKINLNRQLDQRIHIYEERSKKKTFFHLQYWSCLGYKACISMNYQNGGELYQKCFEYFDVKNQLTALGVSIDLVKQPQMMYQFSLKCKSQTIGSEFRFTFNGSQPVNLTSQNLFQVANVHQLIRSISDLLQKKGFEANEDLTDIYSGEYKFYFRDGYGCKRKRGYQYKGQFKNGIPEGSGYQNIKKFRKIKKIFPYKPQFIMEILDFGFPVKIPGENRNYMEKVS